MYALLIAASGLAAVVPILAFLYLIWWLDRYDREPVGLFLLAFAWGAIGGAGTSLIGSTLLTLPLGALLDPAAANSLASVLIAPLVEEPAKAFILLPIAASRHFDNATDGFVYGAAAGLGFGMTENFLYFVDTADGGTLITWASTVLIRTLYSALMHASATSVVGAAIGLCKFRGAAAKLLLPALGLALAMGIHALWNGLLTLDALAGTGGALTALDLLIFPLELATLFVALQIGLWDERRTIHRELADEVLSGLIPPDEVPVLASYLRRRRRGWLPPGVDRRAYIRAATTLAFRKQQARASGSARYADEVRGLREELLRIRGAAR